MENQKTETKVPEKRKPGRPKMTEEQRIASQEKRKREAEERERKQKKIELTESEIDSLITSVIDKRHGVATPKMAAQLDEKAEEVRNIVKRGLYWFNRPRAYTDEDVENALDHYFQKIAETGEYPKIEGIALACGVSRETIDNWRRGENCTQYRSQLLNNAAATIAAIDADLAQAGKIPQVVYIFRAKNFHGLKDVATVETVTQDPLQDVSVQDIRKKYILSANTENQKNLE